MNHTKEQVIEAITYFGKCINRGTEIKILLENVGMIDTIKELSTLVFIGGCNTNINSECYKIIVEFYNDYSRYGCIAFAEDKNKK